MSWKKANRRKPRSWQKRYEGRKNGHNPTSVTVHSFRREDGSFGFYVDPRHAKSGIRTTFEEGHTGTTVRFEYQTKGGDYQRAGQGFIMSFAQRRVVEQMREEKQRDLVAGLREAGPNKIRLGVVETLNVRRGFERVVSIKEVTGCAERMYDVETNFRFIEQHSMWSWLHTDDPMFGKIFPVNPPFISFEFKEIYDGNTHNFFSNWTKALVEGSPKPAYSDVVNKPSEFKLAGSFVVGNSDTVRHVNFRKKS